jgi:hypothetical protein
MRLGQSLPHVILKHRRGPLVRTAALIAFRNVFVVHVRQSRLDADWFVDRRVAYLDNPTFEPRCTGPAFSDCHFASFCLGSQRAQNQRPRLSLSADHP